MAQVRTHNEIEEAANKLHFLTTEPCKAPSLEADLMAKCALHTLNWVLQEKHCSCRKGDCDELLPKILKAADRTILEMQSEFERCLKAQYDPD